MSNYLDGVLNSGTSAKFLSGTGAPAPDLGVVGDMYLDSTASRLYGPKTLSGWGSGIDLQGPPVDLSSASPANVDASAAEPGVSPVASRADHKHDVAVAAPVGLSLGTGNVTGTEDTLALSDHHHSLGDLCTIKVNGSVIGQQPKLNLLAGSNVTLTGAENVPGSTIDVTVNATVGGGGGTTIQFNTNPVSPARPILNFVDGANTSVVYADNPGNTSTDISFDAQTALKVALNGDLVATHDRLNFVEGNGISIDVLDANEDPPYAARVTISSRPFYEVDSVSGSTSIVKNRLTLVNATIGPINLYLPADAVEGEWVRVKLRTVATYHVTLIGGSNNIDESASMVLTTNYEWAELVMTPFGWMQLG